MRTLVLECSSESCSVALFDDDAMIAGSFELLGRGHAERLVPMIRDLPDKGRAARVIAGLGPGSFTGVRVALATARALAFVWQGETRGYPTLALVAAMARAEAGAVPATVAMTGGHGEWFIEQFDAEGQSTVPLASLTPQAALADARTEVVAGNQAEALVALRGSGKALSILPDARCFALLPQAELTERLEPIYGRGPDARLPGAA
ncbi:MAG: tRNA (adenosine(37)-N6)-threonylcarbamoyltransferase complex dimerization subunit type 1 TsaB [Alphaproteobacteria bacterium]|nr:tRNA (adenosine(37)-N6)-threonylcarbamoyltransferase complex dimerization subunit type 1 TsaB [Alphaproteobacteria bacterium]